MRKSKKDFMKFAGIFKDDDKWYKDMKEIIKNRKKFKLRKFKL